MLKFTELSVDRELECITNRLALLDPSGKGISRKLIDIYLEFTESRLKIVLTAVDTLDWNRVQRELHDLKSTSFNLGAENLGEQFRFLELFGKSESSGDFSKALAITSDNFQRVASSIKARFLVSA